MFKETLMTGVVRGLALALVFMAATSAQNAPKVFAARLADYVT
jgi:hypothetical protein